MLFSSRDMARVRLSVRLVSGYAHVFILLLVVTVSLESRRINSASPNKAEASCRQQLKTNCAIKLLAV